MCVDTNRGQICRRRVLTLLRYIVYAWCTFNVINNNKCVLFLKFITRSSRTRAGSVRLHTSAAASLRVRLQRDPGSAGRLKKGWEKKTEEGNETSPFGGLSRSSAAAGGGVAGRVICSNERQEYISWNARTEEKKEVDIMGNRLWSRRPFLCPFYSSSLYLFLFP